MFMTQEISHGIRRPWFSSLRPHATEVQFWGYEIGNLVAAIAGAGGLTALWAAMEGDARRNGVMGVIEGHGDVALTIGVALVIIWVIGARWVGGRIAPGRDLRGIDVLAAGFALVLVVLAVQHEVTPLVAAAVFFVTGSALLRQADVMPMLLKWGGLLLSAGGVCLVALGVTGPFTALGIMTALTGVSVIFAGLLTYKGGVFVCGQQPGRSVLERADQAIAPVLDPILLACVDTVVMPALFWIPKTIKAQKPFLTSMLARLPFRLLSAAAALATLTPAGVLFALACLLWALGDIAIGSLDVDCQ